MTDDFQLEDLLFQDHGRVVFKATGPGGVACHITRLKLPIEVVQKLSLTRFARSIVELKSLEMSCLRSVIDGGLDQVDNAPWVATVTWPGETLAHRVAEGRFKVPDATRLENHGKATIKYLDDTAEMPGALSFDPQDIILSQSDGGEPVETFCIDYFRWFTDWSSGKGIGHGIDPHEMLHQLVRQAVPATEVAEVAEAPESNPSTETPPAPASRLLTPGAPVKVPAKLVKQKTTGAQGRLTPRLVVPGKTPPAAQPEPAPAQAEPAPQPAPQPAAQPQAEQPAAQVQAPAPQVQAPAPQVTQPAPTQAAAAPVAQPQQPLPEAPAIAPSIPLPPGTAIPEQPILTKETPPAVTTTPVPPASTPLPSGPAITSRAGALKLNTGPLAPPSSGPVASGRMLPTQGGPGLAGGASVIGGGPVPPPAAVPLAVPPAKSNSTPLILGTLIALLGLGGGLFFALKGKEDPAPVAEVEQPTPAPTPPAARPAARAEKPPPPARPTRKEPISTSDDTESGLPYMEPTEYDRLVSMEGIEVTLRGKVNEVKRHGSNLYLKMKVAKPQVAAGVERIAHSDFFLESEMKEYMGRTIEVTGAVKVEGNGRAVVFFSQPTSIREVSPE